MAAPGQHAGFTRPNAARVYDYLLGGRNNFAADRKLSGELTDIHPGLPVMARANRRFILAAVTRAAADGITQFLDLGCGLPSSPMVHERARAVDPTARVVYADRDAGVVRHTKAAVHRMEGLAVVAADITDTDAVLKGVAGVINLERPVCVLLGAVLGSMDAATARAAVAAYAAVLAPQSRMVISCASFADPVTGAAVALAARPAGMWRNHSAGDVASFFAADGLTGEWLDGLGAGPVLVGDVRCWPMVPSGARKDACVLGGVGVLG